MRREDKEFDPFAETPVDGVIAAQCAVQVCTVLYCTVLYSTVLCCTVLNLYCELYFRAYGSFPDRLYVVYQGNIVYQVGAEIRILNSAMLSVEDE